MSDDKKQNNPRLAKTLALEKLKLAASQKNKLPADKQPEKSENLISKAHKSEFSNKVFDEFFNSPTASSSSTNPLIPKVIVSNSNLQEITNCQKLNISSDSETSFESLTMDNITPYDRLVKPIMNFSGDSYELTRFLSSVESAEKMLHSSQSEKLLIPFLMHKLPTSAYNSVICGFTILLGVVGSLVVTVGAGVFLGSSESIIGLPSSDVD